MAFDPACAGLTPRTPDAVDQCQGLALGCPCPGTSGLQSPMSAANEGSIGRSRVMVSSCSGRDDAIHDLAMTRAARASVRNDFVQEMELFVPLSQSSVAGHIRCDTLTSLVGRLELWQSSCV